MKKFLVVLLLLLVTSFAFTEERRITVSSYITDQIKLDLNDRPIWEVRVTAILPYQDSYILEFENSFNDQIFKSKLLFKKGDYFYIGVRDETYTPVYTKYIIKDIKPNVMIIESVDD